MQFGSVPTVGVDALTSEDFLLDVREDDEWEAGHAEGALHIPMSEFVARYGELTEAAPEDGKVYVLCRVGGRSAQVAQYLIQQGVDAVNVAGGMQAWEAMRPPRIGWQGRLRGGRLAGSPRAGKYRSPKVRELAGREVRELGSQGAREPAGRGSSGSGEPAGS